MTRAKEMAAEMLLGGRRDIAQTVNLYTKSYKLPINTFIP